MMTVSLGWKDTLAKMLDAVPARKRQLLIDTSGRTTGRQSDHRSISDTISAKNSRRGDKSMPSRKKYDPIGPPW